MPPASLKPWLYRRIFPPLAWRLLRVWGATWRYEIHGREHLDRVLADPRPRIAVFWHGAMLPLMPFMSRPAQGAWTLMCSNSLDGELQAGVLQGLGFHVIRGSSGHGGTRALVTMIHATRKNRDRGLALAVDGSRGPRGRVQLGAVLLARKTGGWVHPVAAAVRRARVLARAWDQAVVPLPGTRVAVGFGPPIEVPRHVDEGAMDAHRLRIERALWNLQATLDARFGPRHRTFSPPPEAARLGDR